MLVSCNGDQLVMICDSLVQHDLNMGFGVQVQPAAESQMSLADLETVKVIGKGSGGVVQLVRHKFSNNMYALKVIFSF